MARTFYKLMDEAQSETGRTRDQKVTQATLDAAFRAFWNDHPWRETLGEMTPFYLVPGWQRYTAPYIEVPTDFQDVFAGRLVQINVTSGVQRMRPLKPIGNIEEDSWSFGAARYPEAFGYNFYYQAFMVDCYPSGRAGELYIAPVYKKTVPYRLTAENASTNEFPIERHEDLFKEWLKWHMMGKPTEMFQRVRLQTALALKQETPGQQMAASHPEPIFGQLGT